MIRLLVGMILATSLSGCSRDPGPPVPITYATGTPVDGSSAWEATITETTGRFRNARLGSKGERTFPMTPEKYRAISELLATIRPNGEQTLSEDTTNCRRIPANKLAIDVSWGDSDRLIYFVGCEGGPNQRTHSVLLQVEQMLPVQSML